MEKKIEGNLEMNKNIDIFYCADDKFVPHLATSIASVLKNANEDENISIYVLNADITENNKKLLYTLSNIKEFKLEFLYIDGAIFEGYEKPDYINSSAFLYRYLIPQIKPDIQKALYFDCDTIIKQSLWELFNTNIDDYYIAGVEDFHWMMSFKRLKLNSSINEPYFNSGVLLINCEKWREKNLYNELIKITDSLNPKVLEQLDQDAINIVCTNKKLVLPPKYNLLSCWNENNMFTSYKYKDLQEAIKSPVVIHYSGPIKPWMEESFPVDEFAYEYHRYAQLTHFYDKNFRKRVSRRCKELVRLENEIKGNLIVKFFIDLWKLPVQINSLIKIHKEYKTRKRIFWEKTGL